MFELYGRDTVKTFLEGYVKGPTYHPLMLVGDKGVGKKYVSKLIFRALNNISTEQDNEDFLYYCLENRSWGIDDIRDLVAKIDRPPMRSDYRVISMSSAERITPEGSDVFLKQVEEFKPYNVFVFSTPCYNEVMPALCSRCWKVYVPPIQSSELLDKQEVAEGMGLPELVIHKSYQRREQALIFLESFFEPGILLKTKKMDPESIKPVLEWINFILAVYFTNRSERVTKRLSPIFEKYDKKAVLAVFSNLSKLYQKISGLDSIRVENHLFQTLLDTQVDLRG